MFADESGDVAGHPVAPGELGQGGGWFPACAARRGQLTKQGGHGRALPGLLGQAGCHHLAQFGR